MHVGRRCNLRAVVHFAVDHPIGLGEFDLEGRRGMPDRVADQLGHDQFDVVYETGRERVTSRPCAGKASGLHRSMFVSCQPHDDHQSAPFTNASYRYPAIAVSKRKLVTRSAGSAQTLNRRADNTEEPVDQQTYADRKNHQRAPRCIGEPSQRTIEALGLVG